MWHPTTILRSLATPIKPNLPEGRDGKPPVLTSTEKPWMTPRRTLRASGCLSQYRHELLNRYSMKLEFLGTCEHCGQPLEGDSPILGIVHCPNCDGPFSRRVLMRWLMAAFWGALFPLGLGFFAYFFWLTPMQNGETILLGICIVMWLLMTLIVTLQKILPENIGFHGGGDFGGGNGGG